MCERNWVLSLLFATAVVWQTPAHAGVFLAAPLEQLVETSDFVVVATVTDIDGHYEDINGQRRIVTDVSLQIDYALERADGSRRIEPKMVTVRRLGGTVGEVTEVVYGEAVLLPGSTNLLFLNEDEEHRFYVNAMAQGEYVLQSDDSGELLLRPSPGLDFIVKREQSAVTELAGRSLSQAEALVVATTQKVRALP
jgi:hypothetical protein